ncbi:Hypothetical predicted protein, partial [Olea europaea subsp. europaea]
AGVRLAPVTPVKWARIGDDCEGLKGKRTAGVFFLFQVAWAKHISLHVKIVFILRHSRRANGESEELFVIE